MFLIAHCIPQSQEIYSIEGGFLVLTPIGLSFPIHVVFYICSYVYECKFELMRE